MKLQPLWAGMKINAKTDIMAFYSTKCFASDYCQSVACSGLFQAGVVLAEVSTLVRVGLCFGFVL